MDVELLEAWARWLDGQRVDGLRLWGRPILHWGRLGKLLQFAAGLVVVLDLVGARRIHAVARALGGHRWADGVERVRAHNAEYRRRRRLIAARVAVDRAEAVLGEAEDDVRRDRLGPLVGGDWELPGHRGSSARPVDPEREARRQEARAESAAAREAASAPGADRPSRWWGWVALAAIALWLGALLWAVLTGDGGRAGWADAAEGLGLFAGLLLVVQVVRRPTAASWLEQGVLLVVVVARIAYGLLVTILATALASAFGGRRADYRIRLAAFALFVVGFQFDLLAS